MRLGEGLLLMENASGRQSGKPVGDAPPPTTYAYVSISTNPSSGSGSAELELHDQRTELIQYF